MNQHHLESFENRLLGLGLAKHDCLVQWLLDASCRFAPRDRYASDSLEQLGEETAREKKKLEIYLQGKPNINEFREPYREFENRFEGEKHYFIMDRIMARRLLNSLVIAINDLELFYSQCSDQTADKELKLLYRKLREKAALKQDVIRQLIEEQKRDAASPFGVSPSPIGAFSRFSMNSQM